MDQLISKKSLKQRRRIGKFYQNCEENHSDVETIKNKSFEDARYRVQFNKALDF